MILRLTYLGRVAGLMVLIAVATSARDRLPKATCSPPPQIPLPRVVITSAPTFSLGIALRRVSSAAPGRR